MSGLNRVHDGTVLIYADDGTLPTTGGIPLDANDGILDLNGYAYGAVFIPTAWTTADLAFTCSNRRDGTYTMLRKTDGTAVKIDIDNKTMWYAIPAEVFMAQFVKFWSVDQTTPTTPVAQAGGPLTLTLTVGT